MTKKQAARVLKFALYATSCRVSEVFGDGTGDQWDGYSTINRACHTLGVLNEKFSELQNRYLDLRSDVTKVLDEFVSREFLRLTNMEAPTNSEILMAEATADRNKD